MHANNTHLRFHHKYAHIMVFASPQESTHYVPVLLNVKNVKTSTVLAKMVLFNCMVMRTKRLYYSKLRWSNSIRTGLF